MGNATDQPQDAGSREPVVRLQRFDGSTEGLWSVWNRLLADTPSAPDAATARGDALSAGKPGAFTLEVTLAEPIAAGGRLVVGPRLAHTTRHQPFQSNRPAEPGYVSARLGKAQLPVRCTTDAHGVSLVVVEFEKRAPAQAVVNITVGDTTEGSPGWTAPPRAEAHLGFLVMVDRDGSQQFARLRDVPGITVKPARATALRGWLSGPDEAGAFCITVLAEDDFGNPVPLRRSSVTVRDEFFSTFVPEVEETESKTLRVRGLDLQSGSFQTIRIAGPGNKVDVATPPADFLKDLRIVFGDLRCELASCDGTDVPEPADVDEAMRWAAEVEGLDFAAFTPSFGSATPHAEMDRRWKALVEVLREVDRPGRFVPVPGYQWIDPAGGSRQIVLFADLDNTRLALPGHSRSCSLEKLCSQLKASAALLVPGRDVAPDRWSGAAHRMHPGMFPVAEIVSAGGLCALTEIDRLQTGASLTEALSAGVRTGLIGTSGSTVGRPGFVLDGLGKPSRPGLCAAMVDRLDRDGLFEALRKRRCYAVSGSRILLDVRLNDAVMGEVVEAEFIERLITVRTWAPEPIKDIHIIKNAEVIYSVGGAHRYETAQLHDYIVQTPLDWYAVHVRLTDGSQAWSSPIWVRQMET